jgi:hypothetical protein
MILTNERVRSDFEWELKLDLRSREKSGGSGERLKDSFLNM